MAGIAVALVGYLGADVAPTPLALNAGTLRLAASAVVRASVGCGLKKIETHLALLHLTQRRLYLQEVAGAHAQVAVKDGTHLNEATGEVISAAVAAERAEILSQQAAGLTKEIEDLRDGVDRWVASGSGRSIPARFHAGFR